MFAFPFIIQERNENYELTTKGILIYSIIPLTFLLTFYLNTLILIPQILFRNSKLGYVFANLIMITIFSLCINQEQKQFPPPINKKFHKYNPKKDSDIELQHSKIDTFENQIFKRVNKKPAKELN